MNDFGLFSNDDMLESTGAVSSSPRVIPPVPDTGWCAPHEFPRLGDARELVIDVETKDPHLETHGPGWATGDGHVVGLAVGTHDRQWYFPMRHENPDGTRAAGNMDADMVLKWAREELTRESQSKLGANLLYDIGWLKREGVNVKGELIDVQFAEALLDEHSFSYALSSLGRKYLDEGKTEDELYNWLQRAYGGPAGRKQARNIYRSPVALCGVYAEGDVDLPYRIYQAQKEVLEQEGLTDLFRMECDLIPQLVQMRWNGVRVDVEGAERTQRQFENREKIIQVRLDKFSGRSGFSPDAPTDMKSAFDKLGLKPGKTPGGGDSFAKGVLESIDHPFTKAIMESRKLSKARGTFIEGYILDKHHNGRVHGEFHSLKRDDAGTVTGRFSSSRPNLGNIPARDVEMKKAVRGLFLPESGQQWFAPDYSQIQFREITHYAMGPGSDEARQKYIDDPTTDYHDLTKSIIDTSLGGDMDRKPVKNINFGLAFGMSEKRIIHDLGQEGAAIMQAYEEALPFVKHTSGVAKNRASSRGYLKSMLGRRVRFPFWECSKYYTEKQKKEICDEKNDPKWFNYTQDKVLAVTKWGQTRRAMTHKALVSLAQATEADIMKSAMLEIYKAGLPTPLVTVYDELGFSLDGPGEVSEEIMRIMRDTIKLRVPILVDGDFGANWGAC